MTPGTKRTIITSKTTGRRYFLVRSAHRPSGRRYYVCTNPTCKARVSREADLYCKAHAQDQPEQQQQQLENDDTADISTKSDPIDENDIEDNGEVLEEETSTKTRKNTRTDSNRVEQIEETENNDSPNKHNTEEVNDSNPTDSSTPLSPNSQTNRQVQIDEKTGTRTFRDSSGRRRYLCAQLPCANILRRQSDIFCRLHMPTEKTDDNSKRTSRTSKRKSAPPVSNQSKKNRYRSPFQTPVTTTTSSPPPSAAPPVAPENGTNGSQSDEYETPKKSNTPQRIGTTRTFRDASGKLRFLCSITTCHSRVPRQSELYCKRHQQEAQNKQSESSTTQSLTTNGTNNEEKSNNQPEAMDVQIDKTTSSRQTTSDVPVQSETKKRKRESSISLSLIPANQIVIATTTLLDDQWTDVLSFIRQFPQVQLSTNLNVNNLTTHLLVDDSENHLHCTITKKIVQAAVRQHIFIISSRWLNECIRLNTFIDEHSYEIQSDSHTTLRLSKQDLNLTNKYLFSPTSQSLYAFAIECRQCQGSINRSELIELIQLTGAQLFQMEQAVDILIVLCDTNDKNLNKIKEKYIQAPASNIKYVTSDFLLKSIIKFEIQDIDKYSL
ncbi:unnamed protein product [Adineta steineri]|uniref:BRCT domain-containing protein n=1 Tax=Adineta steineri TaxID=433720 RepID=A0A814YGR7_9BILA|nr:unnamed protein product [Adineta steineri]CAF3947422.1 unnamed protein product [Adineta steineri]